MKKKSMVAVVLALIAGSASAVLVESWQFNDDVDTRLDQVANGGTAATTWNFRFGNPDVGLTSGDGMMTIGDDGAGGASTVAVATDYTRKATMASAVTTGIYSFEMKIGSWSLGGGTGGTAGQGLTVKFGDGVGGNTVNLIFDWRNATTVRTRHAASGVLGGTAAQASLGVSGSDLWLRIEGNLDTGAYTSSYSTDGSSYNAVISDGSGLVSITETIMVLEGTDPWVSGEFIDVDYMQIDVIPEPATLGVISMTGLGLLFIRRRFMI